MNEPRNAKAILSKILFLLTAVVLIGGGRATGQQSLRDLAKSYGCDWLVGRWTVTTDEGVTLSLVYKWELDGHLMTSEFRMGEYAARGMIFYVQGEEKAVGVNVDNRGGRSKVTWEAQDDKLVSKSEHVDAEGNTRKSAAVYSNIDAKTMKISIYGLNEDGGLSEEPWFSMDFKRQAVRKKDKLAAKSQKKIN